MSPSSIAFAGLAPAGAVLVADLGGTKTTTAWMGPDARARDPHTAPSRALDGPDAVLGVLTDGLNRARRDAEAAGFTPVAVGVGSAGVIDGGRVVSATASILDWTGTDIEGHLRAELGLPARVLNDVHAHGLGEAVLGAGAEHDSMLLVAVGTGIGGAMVTGGEVFHGSRGAAGHIGHMSVPEAAGVPCTCGATGHLEGLASGVGILQAYNRHGEHADSTHEVFRRAAEGQNLARNVITDCAFATGRAIGDLLNILDPAIVVISGGIAETGEIWWEPLRRGVGASAMRLLAGTPIVPAGLGPHAPLVGAGHYALSRTATR